MFTCTEVKLANRQPCSCRAFAPARLADCEEPEPVHDRVSWGLLFMFSQYYSMGPRVLLIAFGELFGCIKMYRYSIHFAYGICKMTNTSVGTGPFNL